ncbi:MAG: hypothetical protein SFV19_12820 [Rhodospirillaceae bacterium]|nr:hypothetical protein [Rhodospirillaceae bacterium]
MKKLVLAAMALAISGGAMAQDKPNYVAAQVTSSKSKCKGFQDGLAPLGLTTTCDVRDEGWRIAYGRYFNEFFGAELGYQDAGEGTAFGRLPNGTLAVTLKSPMKAVDLVGTARWEVQDGIVGMVRFGGAWWDYEVIATPATGFGAKNDKITLTYGVGLEYRFFTLGFDIISKVGQGNLLVPTGPDIKQDVKRISAGLKYQF